jgi:MFS transporter, FSR family, fosmidomycin resistance protein
LSTAKTTLQPAVQPVDTTTTFQTGGVVTVSAAHGVHDTYTAFLAPLLPVLIENLSLTKTAAGWLAVFYNFPSLLQPLIGHLGDRVNLRILVVLAPAISAAAMTLLGVAPTYGVLVLLMLVAGLSSAGLHAIGPVLGGVMSGRSLGRGMSFWMVGGELGRTFGPLILVGAVTALTPRGLPQLMIGGMIASVVIFWRLRSVPAYRPAAGGGVAVGPALRRMRPVLLTVAAVVTFRALLFAAVTTFLPTFLTEEGADLWFAGASLSVMEAAGVVGALAGGMVSDRIGRRRVMISMTAAAPLAVLLFLNVSGGMQYLALMLTGLTLLSTGPVLMALVQERAGESRALANGVFMALNFVITSLAMLVVGILGDRYGLRMALNTAIVVMLAGVPFTFFLPRD